MCPCGAGAPDFGGWKPSTSLEVLSCGEVQHASHLQVRHTHQKEQLSEEGSQTRTG